jgi:hypothetical protein
MGTRHVGYVSLAIGLATTRSAERGALGNAENGGGRRRAAEAQAASHRSRHTTPERLGGARQCTERARPVRTLSGLCVCVRARARAHMCCGRVCGWVSASPMTGAPWLARELCHVDWERDWKDDRSHSYSPRRRHEAKRVHSVGVEVVVLCWGAECSSLDHAVQSKLDGVHTAASRPVRQPGARPIPTLSHTC